jgi:uncharacterized membrane protein YvbJ
MKSKNINSEQPEKILDCSNIFGQSILIDFPKKNKKKLKNRKDNSLDELTKKFIKFVLEEKSNIINLEEMRKKMKSQKRRIYDITNVFQGKLV